MYALNHAYTDQMLILKEKDKIWKAKLDQAELDRDKHIEKSQNLEHKLQQAQIEIERHTKYHEKIKNQVKPYITQLKEYCKSLENKNIYTFHFGLNSSFLFSSTF